MKFCKIQGLGSLFENSLHPQVNFIVYFWTESQQANVLKVRDQVATRIKYALDAAGIDMPFPHTVVLFHDWTQTRNEHSNQTAPMSTIPN